MGQTRATTVTINGLQSNDDFRFNVAGSNIVDITIDNVGKLKTPRVHEPSVDSLFISIATTTNTSGYLQWNSSVIFGQTQGFNATFDNRQLDGVAINYFDEYSYEQDLYPPIKKPFTADKAGPLYSSNSTEFHVTLRPYNKQSILIMCADPTLSPSRFLSDASPGYRAVGLLHEPIVASNGAPASPYSCVEDAGATKMAFCGSAVIQGDKLIITELSRLPTFSRDKLDNVRPAPPFGIEGAFNGDGRHDWVIGDGSYANFQHQLSRLVVSYGYSGATIENELNYRETPRTGSNGFVVNGWEGEQVALFAMTNLNNDAYSDLVLSFPNASVNGFANAGMTYVLFSRANFGASVDITALSLNEGFVIEGTVANGHCGSSVLAMDNGGVIIGGLANAEQSGHGCGYSVLFARNHFTDVVVQSTQGQTASMPSDSIGTNRLGYTIAVCTTERGIVVVSILPPVTLPAMVLQIFWFPMAILAWCMVLMVALQDPSQP